MANRSTRNRLNRNAPEFHTRHFGPRTGPRTGAHAGVHRSAAPKAGSGAAPGTGAVPGQGAPQPGPDNAGQPGERGLLSRRGLIMGAAGLGAVAVIAGGAVALNSNSQDTDVTYLEAPESALSTQADFEALETYKTSVRTIASFDLPINSLVWMNDDNVAACLLPTDTGSPLTQIGILGLGTGLLTTVLDKAVGADEHFEIYDVRATSSGVIWTEANILEGVWHVYAATLADGNLGTPMLLEEADSTYEMPTLAAVGNKGFWQVLPRATDSDAPASRLMAVTFGASEGSVVLESARRMCTPPYATEDSVVVTPRVDSSTMYYQLTNINAASGQITDTLTLPSGMHPLEAGYGPNGFMFSFSEIYNFGGAIANLGTYTPMAKPADGNYSQAQWFGFARTPTAAPAWCGHLLLVKSTYSVCGVDLPSRTYFAIDVENGADSYGDYLATSGTHSTFVTYTNVDYTPVGKDPVSVCRVKVWELGASPDAFEDEEDKEDEESSDDKSTNDEESSEEEASEESTDEESSDMSEEETVET